MSDRSWHDYWSKAAEAEILLSAKMVDTEAIHTLRDSLERVAYWLSSPSFPPAVDPGGYCFIQLVRSKADQAELLLPQCYLLSLWFKASFWIGPRDGDVEMIPMTANMCMQWELFMEFLEYGWELAETLCLMRTESLYLVQEFLSFIIPRNEYLFNESHVSVLVNCRTLIERVLLLRIQKIFSDNETI